MDLTKGSAIVTGGFLGVGSRSESDSTNLAGGCEVYWIPLPFDGP